MDEREHTGCHGAVLPSASESQHLGRKLIHWLRGDRALLLGLQLAVAAVLFYDFLLGRKYFAFFDIGSDTYFQFVPAAIHLAANSGILSGWSFSVGLGTAVGLLPDPFSLLGIAGGSGHVLDLRIWVYLFKIVLGGLAFHGFLVTIGARREAALLAAFSYSFCGQIVSDGQWDPHATEFAVYPLILWALARQRYAGDLWPIPMAIAFATVCGVFPFSVGVFVGYCFIANLVVASNPASTLKTWCLKTFPLCALGFLLAAPNLVPLVLALLDSPRVTGPQAGFSKQISGLLSVNDLQTVWIEIAGFFHKNLLGVGNQYRGWMNYLEGPGYFTGLLSLLLLPQLWRGNRIDRRILLAGLIVMVAFVTFPAIRYIAFGFALDYFRVNNLWLSLLLLTLFAHSLGVVAEKGINGRLLAVAAFTIGATLVLLEVNLGSALWMPHAYRILALSASALIFLAILSFHPLPWRNVVPFMVAFIAIETALVAYPSFHAGRQSVDASTPGFNDATIPALAAIREHDRGFYRVEKTYDSVSLCDALAQDYRGVKSYWFQNRSTVALYIDLALLPAQSSGKNFTNWLPSFGGRFVLNTLFGVKYLLADVPVELPGFQPVHQTGGVTIYRNELALPLGFVYEYQLPHDKFMALDPVMRDLALLNAVIVDQPGRAQLKIFDVGRFAARSISYLEDNYVAPARALQQRGMQLSYFSDSLIRGSVISDIPGTMVFSIPFSTGWTVLVDGKETPSYKANVGMTAIDLAAGSHQVELRYRTPGLMIGLLASALGFIGLAAIVWLKRRVACGENERNPQ